MRNNVIIQKMILYIGKISVYINGLDYSTFSENSITVDACVFNLSQLGELTTKLDGDFIAKHSDIPWNEMRGLRNRIVHDYEGVNLKLVWEIVSEDLPKLKKQLEKIS
ncbi:MAG: DUF86 domain-containing protein [Clostridia bacterium]|nr:DUF86 domain-containing protein [Clostridia bacterium]